MQCNCFRRIGGFAHSRPRLIISISRANGHPDPEVVGRGRLKVGVTHGRLESRRYSTRTSLRYGGRGVGQSAALISAGAAANSLPMQRKLLVTCAVTVFLLVAALAIAAFVVGPRSGFSVASTDKRIKVYDFQYFPGQGIEYSYPPTGSRLRIRIEGVLEKLGLTRWTPLPGTFLRARGKGPAVFLLASFQGGNPGQLELLTDDGDSVARSVTPMQIRTNLYLWQSYGTFFARTNQIYHLRCVGETNDLAIVRVR